MPTQHLPSARRGPYFLATLVADKLTRPAPAAAAPRHPDAGAAR